MQVTQKSFKFAEKYGLPFYFVSASDGTNVVRIFHKAILEGEGTVHVTPHETCYVLTYVLAVRQHKLQCDLQAGN